MNGLGGLNKSPGGGVLGLVQLQNPNVVTPDDLAAQCRRICDLTAKARRGMPNMDLVVFPEYALHGLSMDTNPAIMCRIDPRRARTARRSRARCFGSAGRKRSQLDAGDAQIDACGRAADLEIDRRRRRRETEAGVAGELDPAAVGGHPG